jgi:hypothetical protein
MKLADQIAALRAQPATNPRQAKSKREQLARLERKLVGRWGRRREVYREPPF